MKFQLASCALGILMLAARANARTCDEVVKFLSDRAADVVCFESPDLTTNNEATTPEDNSLPGLPPGAFTPRTDRATISPDPPDHTPIYREVPGIQVQGRFADDPTGEARFLLRFPNDWNGRLVVAGASGTRSEFNGDFAWSDLVVQRGYAYASQNKGVLNLFITDPETDPLACRLNPVPPLLWVHFYDNDPEKPFTQWQHYMVRGARLARRALEAHYGHEPRRTYAVGTSNGGYQVRRAIEEAPELFDGGVDWEGTFVDPDRNILIDLPPAIRTMPDYIASGHDPNGDAAQAIRAAGYPPDILGTPLTLWERYYLSFWEVTMCQWQKRLDPDYDTYGSGPGNYDYFERREVTDVAEDVAAFQNTGRVRRPLLTVAGTMDALLPINGHARPYAEKVASHHHHHHGRDYRLYEVQNGNHIESYKTFYPQLELIQPHAHRAFDLLVDHVEHHRPLPPSQCIPRGGSIVEDPGSEHCEQLFVGDED